jgi:hypothetical protein
MALGSTQPLTPGIFPGGKGGWCVGLTILPPSCADCLKNLGASTSWNPQGLSRPVMGLLYLSPCILRLATSWTIRGSNPGWGDIFCTRPERPWATPASYTMGTGSFPGVKRPGRGFDHTPHLTQRLKKE